MGYLRFFLAFSVAYYHIDDWTKISGQGSVFCFYVLSGYLISKAYHESYSHQTYSSFRFYLNRFIKLSPTLSFSVLITIAAGYYIVHNGITHTGFQFSPYKRTLDSIEIEPIQKLLQEILLLNIKWASEWPFFTPSPTLVPQTWSLLIEAIFYGLAPILVILAFKNKSITISILAASLLFSVYLVFFKKSYNLAYEHFLPALYAFLVGQLSYVSIKEKSIKTPFLGYTCYVGFPAILFFIYLYLDTKNPDIYYIFMILNVFLTALIVPLLMAFQKKMPRWLGIADRKMGDMAFGIYLLHNTSAILIMTLESLIQKALPVSDLLGGYRSPLFIYSSLVLTLFLSSLTLDLIERPIKVLRNKIRGGGAATVSQHKDGKWLPPLTLVFFGAFILPISVHGALKPWSLQEAIAASDAASIKAFLGRAPDAALSPDLAPEIVCAALKGGDGTLAAAMRARFTEAPICDGQTALGLALSQNDAIYLNRWIGDAEPNTFRCEQFGKSKHDSIEIVLDQGKIGLTSCSMSELLYFGATTGNSDLVALLLDKESVPENAVSEAFCQAIIHKNGGIIERLIDRNAKIPRLCPNGRAPEDIALEMGADGLAALLTSRRTD